MILKNREGYEMEALIQRILRNSNSIFQIVTRIRIQRKLKQRDPLDPTHTMLQVRQVYGRPDKGNLIRVRNALKQDSMSRIRMPRIPGQKMTGDQ